MKKVLVVLLLLMFVLTACKKQTSNTQSTQANQTATVSQDDKMMANENSASRYVEYSKNAYDQVAGKRRVLYFYASWCPICRPADADFKANMSKIPEDVVVLRVNYNDPETDSQEKDLAKTYGITYQHTFVQVDASGNQVTKWNGGQLNELLAKIK